MIWAHVWSCGKFVWRLVTLQTFNALPHLTQKMILAKVAKLALGGGILACAGTGAWFGPRLIGGGELPAVWHRKVVTAPEPSGLLVMVAGIGGVLMVRRWPKL